MRIAAIVLLGALLAHAEGSRVEMTFHVDRDTAKEIDSDEKAQKAAEDDTPVILRRLQAADIKGVQVAQMKWQVRVTLENADADTAERVKRLVSTVGRLEIFIDTENQEELDKDIPGSRVLARRDAGEEPARLRVKVPAVLGSDSVATASASQTPEGWAILVKLAEKGKSSFADVTKQSVGKRLAIALDGELWSAPTIREAIVDGTARVSGSFTEFQARDLSAILDSGPLPAPLKLVSEK